MLPPSADAVRRKQEAAQTWNAVVARIVEEQRRQQQAQALPPLGNAPAEGKNPEAEALLCEEQQQRADRELAAEGNIVAACCVFASAIALDALNALPTTIVKDVPVSMRTTGLVLVAMIAAPPVEPHFLFEQRGLACVLLAIASWVGLRHGGSNARIADALYSLLGGWAAVVIFAATGPAKGERGHDARGRRENVTALSAGFLGYAGLRITRAGLSHATEAIAFTMTDQDVTARGFAMADDLISSVLVFGGLLCISAALIVLINHDLVYAHGCTPIASVMAMMSVLVFTAAFVVQIASYARLEEMDVLFGEDSCAGARDVCAITYRARRMHAANTSPATLWACAVGLTLFAFPYERRCRTRRDYHESVDGARSTATASGWVAILSALVALVAVALFTDERSYLASLEVLLLYFSIPVAWFGQTWIGCGLHAAGIATYTAKRLGGPFGYDLTYLTHWYVAATLLAVAVLTVTTGVSSLLWSSWCSKRGFVVWIELATALVLVALVSMQLSLTIGSLALVSGYDGSRFSDDRSWSQTSLEWATQHCVSFFFAAALVGGRYEVQNPCISRWLLRAVWFGVPLLLLGCWVVAMASTESTVPYFATGEPAPIIIAAFAALVPWIVVGVVVC